MRLTSFLYSRPSQWGALAGHWAASWWRMLLLGAIALVLAFSPSTYTRAHRCATSRQIYHSAWQVLPWFAALSALVSLVIIRIVLVTALSYGLSRFALEMVVRVLVLELIPLSAALFVALRAGLAFNATLLDAPAFDPGQPASAPWQRRRDLVAEVSGNAFAVLTLAMVSSVLVLLLAYLNVYGLSPWGLDDYTRTVGRVFEPTVSIGFALKTMLFGLAVAVIPAAAILELQRFGGGARPSMQPGAVRLLFVLLMIEAASLAVKYF